MKYTFALSHRRRLCLRFFLSIVSDDRIAAVNTLVFKLPRLSREYCRKKQYGDNNYQNMDISPQCAAANWTDARAILRSEAYPQPLEMLRAEKTPIPRGTRSMGESSQGNVDMLPSQREHINCFMNFCNTIRLALVCAYSSISAPASSTAGSYSSAGSA